MHITLSDAQIIRRPLIRKKVYKRLVSLLKKIADLNWQKIKMIKLKVSEYFR